MSSHAVRWLRHYAFSVCHQRAAAPVAVALIAAMVMLSACTAGGNTTTTTSTGNTSTATATTAPTATPKPKPTSLPPITQAFCQQLLSIAEANQIMQPANAATRIQVFTSPNGGLCDYMPPATLAYPVVQIRLATYSGQRPIPDQDIQSYFKQGLNQPGVTVLTNTPVGGVGDQAGIVVGSYTINGTTAYGAAFYVLYGNVVFFCGDVYASSPTTAQRGALQQCAQLVVGRL